MTFEDSLHTLTQELTLLLSMALRGDLARWIRAGYPQETCGLLIGHRRPEVVIVDAVAQAGNMNHVRAHDRFELDPQDFFDADQAAVKAGREIVGIWHSHPDQRAEPSDADRSAAWAGWSYLIVEVTRAGTGAMRSWRLVRDGFVEETLMVEGSVAT